MDQQTKDGRRGYLLVRLPHSVMQNYESGTFSAKNQSELVELRAGLSCIGPMSYRGIDRQPLMPFPSHDEAIIQSFRESGIDMDFEQAASGSTTISWPRRRLAESPMAMEMN